MHKLNILLAASEVVPFAKSGGLADVAGALPKALHALGHDVRVVMPRYYIVDREKYGLRKLDGVLGIPMGSMGDRWAAVYEGRLPGSEVPVYFIEHDAMFGRKGLYDDEHGYAYIDNDNRFILFSRAVMELAKMLDFRPDILHANDWHTGTLPLLLNSAYVFDPFFDATASVMTIHNMQHQGRYYRGAVDVMGISWNHFNHYELEDHGGVNMLKGGIVHADAVTTVSGRYAQEIQTPEFGWGLHDVVRAHAGKLHGIVNGVDYDEWNPAADPLIPAAFDTEDMAGKSVCKRELQRQFGLAERDDVALIGLVGRLAEQKGIGLIAGAVGRLMQMDIQIVLLGTGEKWAEHFFGDLVRHYPGRFACHIGYDNTVAHRIEAGSDFFLMPSLFEPCGLNQIYSLRYGTLPIVRATGGLDDTIENYDPASGRGTGFKCYDATVDALVGTVAWAVDTWYGNPEAIAAMRREAMTQCFSWEASASAYVDVYRRALEARRRDHH